MTRLHNHKVSLRIQCPVLDLDVDIRKALDSETSPYWQQRAAACLQLHSQRPASREGGWESVACTPSQCVQVITQGKGAPSSPCRLGGPIPRSNGA